MTNKQVTDWLIFGSDFPGFSAEAVTAKVVQPTCGFVCTVLIHTDDCRCDIECDMQRDRELEDTRSPEQELDQW